MSQLTGRTGWIVGLAAVLASAMPAQAAVVPPGERTSAVDLARELAAPWQAGGAIVLYADASGQPRAGRDPAPPADAAEEQARRAEHWALARRLNLVTAAGMGPPAALPLMPEQLALLERFALSDAGAVWFRELADDTLRLFNKGYLDYDAALWRAAQDEGRRLPLSALISGRLSEEGLLAQDAIVFRIYAYDGPGAMASANSVRLGLAGMRCHFSFSQELVDPMAVLSHEFGHTRYGDARSAGTPLGEAHTVARYENPVRLRNGYPPRTVYYLRLDARTPIQPRDALMQRLLAQWRAGRIEIDTLDPVQRLHCACGPEEDETVDCTAGPPERPDCSLRWLAVRVPAAETAGP
ncbi:MAG: hypothetical protein N2Z63_03895 [Thiobacillaceae bacterium]|nr:hypothetical protein [Thiobacillaceae bacterium]